MLWVFWVLLLHHLAPILVFGACVAGFYFLFTPLLISTTFRFEANPTVNVIDPVEVPLPPVVQDHFSEVDAKLVPRGFEDRGTSLVPSVVPNVTTFVRSYTNGRAGTSAMATSIFWMIKSNPAAGTKHVPFVQFTTRYEGGEVFTTHNARMAGSFPRRPNRLSIRVPWITDAIELYQVHLAITSARRGRGRKRLLLDEDYGGDVAAYGQDMMREELVDAAEAGYV